MREIFSLIGCRNNDPFVPEQITDLSWKYYTFSFLILYTQRYYLNYYVNLYRKRAIRSEEKKQNVRPGGDIVSTLFDSWKCRKMSNVVKTSPTRQKMSGGPLYYEDGLIFYHFYVLRSNWTYHILQTKKK